MTTNRNGTGQHSIEAIELSHLAEQIVTRIKRDSSPPPRKFLGLTAGGWTPLLMMPVIAALIATVIYWRDVDRDIRERPTMEQAAQAIERSILVHTEGAGSHPKSLLRLEKLETKQSEIREAQIRQEDTVKHQTELLEDIRKDVRRLR